MGRLSLGLLAASALILLACSGSDTSTPSSSSPLRAPTSRTTRSIRVESQIVKQVGGKHRYFFDIRNRDEVPFSGSVTITLIGDVGPLARDTFSAARAIEPGLGTSVYVDANTGPVSVHGSAGIKTFKFEAKDADVVVASGTGVITDRLEPL